MSLERPGELVEVEWLDSTGYSEWHTPDEATEMLTKMECVVIPGDSLEHLRGIDIIEVIDKQAQPGIAIEVEALAEREAA